MSDKAPYPHLFRKAEIEAKEFAFTHPWNPNSRSCTRTWAAHSHCNPGSRKPFPNSRRRFNSSRRYRLRKRNSGRDSLVEHMHHREEEWIYILSGRAVAIIDGERYEMAAGDFAAFPTPSVTHNLSNPYDETVVYMMGGEHADSEIADFPDLDRRMVRLGDDMQIFRLSDGKPFFADD